MKTFDISLELPTRGASIAYRGQRKAMVPVLLDLELPFEPPQTDRARELIRIFGLREERIRHQRLVHRCRIEVLAGDVIFITGASGAGKTVLLDAMAEQIDPDDRLRLCDIPREDDRPVIDCFGGSVLSAT